MPANITRTASAKGPVATSVRKRLFIIAAVAALSLWAIYPPQEKVKLGLDLNGGVHLVLRVKTDEALQLQTHATAERLRHALTRTTGRLQRARRQRVLTSSASTASTTRWGSATWPRRRKLPSTGSSGTARTRFA